jgi:hypothetical protein
MLIKKIFLIIAFCTMLLLAVIYGVSPQWFVSTFFGLTTLSTDIAHIFRAIMGLYIALGFFWLACAFNDRYINVALVTIIVVASGLLGGRLVSLVADGVPSPLLIAYTVIELTIIPAALWVWKMPEGDTATEK